MDKDTFIDDSIGTFVVDLTEVQNYGTVSKWYPVFHKNKPAGQILFEAAYQPAGGFAQNVNVVQPVIQQPVLVEETVVRQEVPIHTTETITQSSFLSKGGAIPVGSNNLDGGLYGKVVHMEPVSHVPNAHLNTGGLVQDQLPTTQLGGPLSGSLGGGVLGSRELRGNELIGGTHHNVSNLTSGSQLGGNQFMGNQPMNMNTQPMGMNTQSMGMGAQNLGNQFAGSNLPQNFNSTSVSNAQLGGGAPLYKETANHPVSQAKQLAQGHHQNLAGQGNIIPGDLVGGHNQTNKHLGDQNPL